MKIDESIVGVIKEYLVEKLSPDFIYIFGSAAKGPFREDSDIDIAVLLKKPMSAYELFIIKEDLVTLVKREIDLVSLNEASEVFRVQVFDGGHAIYIEDKNKHDYYRLKCYKDYAILNERRKVVIDAVKEEASKE
jgi:predicted nucleotidyltransferase